MTEAKEERTREVHLERYAQLRHTLMQSIGFGAVLQLVCVLFLWRSQSHLVLVGWFVAHLLLGAWRVVVLRDFSRLRYSDPAAALAQAGPIQLGCLASGVLWGLLALLPFPPGDLQVPLFIVFVLAGVTAGGAMAMAPELISAYAFQWAIFALMAARLLVIENGTLYLGMGMTAMLYTLFMAAWTRRINMNALDSIRRMLDARRRETLLQEREARYRELAHHDALTGLPNRLSLQNVMTDLLARAVERRSGVAIIYLDLDHFKDINDSRGHRCGDQLLATIAARLRECLRPDDLVVRMGGDEFLVAAADTNHRDQVELLARRLAASIGAPQTHEGEELAASASMGIAMFPENGSDGDTLLQRADIALYQAKASGRNNHQFYAAEMSVVFDERIFLEQALARALGSEQLFIEYQPLVDLRSGRVTGLEALLRWRHPERGLVPPLTFIPIAEHCGLIDELGEQVLRMICRQLRHWQAEGLQLVPVAINVSPRQFERGRLAELLVAVCREHHVDPAMLQIEITETALMRGTKTEADTLSMLRGLGTRVLIDDFGIGYSSLNHLKNLAIDGLKIDRSFVRDMTVDDRDAAIVAAIIAIGRSLGIGVLAEGVETERQVEQLRALGCHAAQGNYLHAPMTADHCRALFPSAALAVNQN